MLLGCCHCPGDQPSVPPSDIASSIVASSGGGSGSVVASDGLSFSTITAGGCFCSVIPRRWSVTLSGSGSGFYCTTLCSTHYTGTFTLTYNAGLSASCNPVWASAELAIEDSSSGCPSVANAPRVRLQGTQDIGGTSVTYILYIDYYDLNGTLITAQYRNANETTCLTAVVLSYHSGGFCGFTSGNITVSPA